jgi:23S rRNA (cytosine1962-C5)-methyltransferase
VFTLSLAKGRDARLLGGHLWIYKSEIARVEQEGAPGAVARVQDARGKFLALATANLRSQIAGRILTRIEEPIDEAFLERRLRQALARPGRAPRGPDACRIVFGEGDHLPGLIVDRYADLLVIQILTAGMELLREPILRVLRRIVEPRAIYERSDASSRRLEGLEPRSGFAWGDAETGVWIREDDLEFLANVAEGQKTGFFLDQRENRRIVRRLAAGRAVLDCFCYAGGFSVSAAAGGATSVLGVDLSEAALAWGWAAAQKNGLADRCAFQAANVFDLLRTMDRDGRRFGLIVLDPPAFTKGREALAGALRGYKEINLRAMKLLAPGGVLVTCSCSYHVDAPTFLDMLRGAAADAEREFRMLDSRTQASDHPILLAAKETQYLKCVILEAADG